MQAARTIGVNGHNARPAGVDAIEDELRELQDLPDKPHDGKGLAVVRGRADDKFSIDYRLLTTLIALVGIVVGQFFYYSSRVSELSTRLEERTAGYDKIIKQYQERNDLQDARLTVMEKDFARMEGFKLAQEFFQNAREPKR